MTRAEKAERNRQMVEAAEAKPTPSWEDLGKRFGMSRQAAREIVLRELKKAGRRWRKPDPARRTFKCAACRSNFFHEQGYIGRYCPKHRGKYRDGRPVEGLVMTVRCGWRLCEKSYPVAIAAYQRGRGKYHSRECRNLANAERLRARSSRK